MPDTMNIQPIEPIDIIALLALFLMIAVIIAAVRDAYRQAVLSDAAFELVDKTFADVWDGDRRLELYAWTVTRAKLHGNSNPYIDKVISQRLREFHDGLTPYSVRRQTAAFSPGYEMKALLYQNAEHPFEVAQYNTFQNQTKKQ